VLIGEPGVGKTATRRRARPAHRQPATCPKALKNKRLLSLDLGALLAGCQISRRIRESGCKAVLSEVTRAPKGSSLYRLSFTPWSAPARRKERWTPPTTAEAGLGARRTALRRRHDARRITARNIEKVPRSNRRFQPIYVGEPSVEDTISILRGIKGNTSCTTGVRITD